MKTPLCIYVVLAVSIGSVIFRCTGQESHPSFSQQTMAMASNSRDNTILRTSIVGYYRKAESEAIKAKEKRLRKFSAGYKYMISMLSAQFMIMTICTSGYTSLGKLIKIISNTYFSEIIKLRIRTKLLLLPIMDIIAVRKGYKLARTHRPDIYNLVQEVANRSGIPPLKRVWLIPDHSINAFTGGAFPHESVIGINLGILEKCTIPELRAIIAHECGHIKHRDVMHKIQILMIQSQFKTCLDCGCDTLSKASESMRQSVETEENDSSNTWKRFLEAWKKIYSNIDKENEEKKIAIQDEEKWLLLLKRFHEKTSWKQRLWWSRGLIAATCSVLMIVKSVFSQPAYSRECEYEADEFAARVVGKEAVISSFETMRSEDSNYKWYQSRSHIYSPDQERDREKNPPSLQDMLSTHPSTDARIYRLKQLCHCSHWRGWWLDRIELWETNICRVGKEMITCLSLRTVGMMIILFFMYQCYRELRLHNRLMKMILITSRQ